MTTATTTEAHSPSADLAQNAVRDDVHMTVGAGGLATTVLVAIAGIILFFGILMITRGLATDEFHEIGLKHAAVDLREAFGQLSEDAVDAGRERRRSEFAVATARLEDLTEAMSKVEEAADSGNAKIDRFFVQHPEYKDLLAGLGAVLERINRLTPSSMTSRQLAERLDAYGTGLSNLVADVALYTNEVDERYQRRTGELYVILGISIALLGAVTMATVGLLVHQNRRLARASLDATALADELAETAAKVQAEARQRREAESIFRETIEAMTDGFVIYDQDDRLLVCNEAYRRIYARSAKVIREGITFREILEHGLAHGQYPEAGTTVASQSAWLHERLENHARKKSWLVQQIPDGRWLQIRETRSPSGFKVGIRTNITKLKDIENALREKEAEARMLADVAARTTNYVLIGDPQFRIIWVNDALVRASGMKLEEMVGRRASDFLYGPETDQAAAASVQEALSQGNGARVELVFYRYDGSKFWVDLDVRPILGADGTLEKYIAVMTDITERRRTEDRLRDYAEDMQRFAYIASHDLQEPLRKIQTFSTMLTEAIASNDEASVRRSIEVIAKSAGRGRDLVAALLEYSKLRERQIKKAPFDLRELTEAAVADCASPDIDITTAVTVDVPAIEIIGDSQLILIVMQNLIGNALKYRRPDTSPEVRITLEEDSGDECLRLSIRDNGIGFDPALAGRMLQPFKRLVTRDAYEGSGIGLSIVDSIISKHGWSLDVDSKPGHGSVFTIVIPANAMLKTADKAA